MGGGENRFIALLSHLKLHIPIRLEWLNVDCAGSVCERSLAV